MKRKEISTRIDGKSNKIYLRVRRDALMAMGFCPACSEWNDRFPNRICTECCKVISLKERNRKDERNINRM